MNWTENVQLKLNVLRWNELKWSNWTETELTETEINWNWGTEWKLFASQFESVNQFAALFHLWNQLKMNQLAWKSTWTEIDRLIWIEKSVWISFHVQFRVWNWLKIQRLRAWLKSTYIDWINWKLGISLFACVID